jgi:hypothetical protein
MQEIRQRPGMKIISTSRLSYCEPFSSLLAMEDTHFLEQPSYTAPATERIPML